MTDEIDTTRPVELTGINLWTVTSFKRGKTQAGDLKVIVKFKSGEYEFEDSILLAGKPNSILIGRAHLDALGATNYKGSVEDLPLAGKRVWIATHIEERPGVIQSGPDAGKPTVWRNLRCNVALLKSRGYQPETDVPDGCTVPTATAGMGPADEFDAF